MNWSNVGSGPKTEVPQRERSVRYREERTLLSIAKATRLTRRQFDVIVALSPVATICSRATPPQSATLRRSIEESACCGASS